MKILRLIISIFWFAFSFNASFAQDTIHWRSNSPLKWEDFKAIPDTSSEFKAISSPSITYILTYGPTRASFRVFCFFNKDKSWVKRKDSVLLRHEQGHFDIAELFARKLRERFAKIKLSSNIEREFRNVYSEILQLRDKMDSQYDLETNYSRNQRIQNEWRRRIEIELLKFNKYVQ